MTFPFRWKVRAALALGAVGPLLLIALSVRGEFLSRPKATEEQARGFVRWEARPAALTLVGPRSTSSAEVNLIAEAVRDVCRGTIESFWKVRMRALIDLARLGPGAATATAELLDDGEPGVRALASEALGILGDSSVSALLERAVASDPDAQVRLYAARSLGQLGTIRPTTAILKARDSDDVVDVRTHVEMALTGRLAKEGGEIRQALTAFNPGQIDSAVVGQPAPDFHLRGLDGKVHSLAEYRGKSSVILVFLVGDICPYCPGQIAQLRQQRHRIDDLGATLLMVEAHESFRLKTTLGRVKSKVIADIPILADPSQTASAAYGVAMHARAHTEWSNRPASFVIDRSGILRFAHLDSPDRRIDPEDLIQVVRLVNSLDGITDSPYSSEVGSQRGPTGL